MQCRLSERLERNPDSPYSLVGNGLAASVFIREKVRAAGELVEVQACPVKGESLTVYPIA